MKKTILIIAIALSPLSSFAQANSESRDFLKERLALLERYLEKHEASCLERERLAGLELKKYANHEYLGNGFSLGAGVLYVVGSKMIVRGNYLVGYANDNYYYGSENYYSVLKNANNKMSTGKVLCVAGSIFALTGAIYKIEAPIHVKRAGLILSGDGVGVSIKIN